MADTTSVGSVGLDIELTGNIEKQIASVASHVGKALKQSVGKSIGGAFKKAEQTTSKSMSQIKNSTKTAFANVEKTTDKSMTRVGNTIREKMKKAKSEISSVAQSVLGIGKMPKNQSGGDTAKPVGQAQAPDFKGMVGMSGDIGADRITVQLQNLERTLDLNDEKMVLYGRRLQELQEKHGRLFNVDQKNKVQEEILKTETAMHNLSKSSDGAYFKMLELEKKLTETSNSGTKLNQTLEKSSEKLNKTAKSAVKTTNSTKQLGKSASKESSRLGKAATAAGDKFSSMGRAISSAFKRVLVMATLYKAIRGFTSYMNSALATNKQFGNSLQQVKTNLQVAFMPIYQTVLPVINALMSALAKVTGYIASFFSALTGKTYKDSLKAAQGLNTAKTAIDGVGKQAKKTDKMISSLAGFDVLNTIKTKPDDTGDDGGSTSVPAPIMDTSGFDYASTEVSEKVQNMVEKIKKALEPTVVQFNRLKEALIPFKDFVATGVMDFYNRFLKPVGGWVMGEGLPRFIKAIADGLEKIDWGSINKSLNKLWDALAPFAIKVGEGLLWLLENVLVPLGTWVLGEALPRFIEAIADGLEKIDWDNIGKSLNKLWDALAPFAANVGEGLLWLLENVLVPLGTWVINDVLPVFLDLLASAFELLNITIEALKPAAKWLWDNLLQPIAEWTGGVIVSVLESITLALDAIGNWMSENQEVVEVLTIIVGSFAAAWGLVNGAILIWNGIAAIATGITTALGGAIAFLTSPIGIAIAIIGALIAVGVLLYKNWDKIKEFASNLWESIKEAFGKIGDFISGIWDGIKQKTADMWNGVKKTFNNVISFITGTFTGIWTKAWGGIKDIFSGVWDSLVGIVKAPINLIIGLINGLIKAATGGVNGIIGLVNKMSFDVPDWVPLIGGKKFGFSIPKVKAPQIPYLAKGGIIDQPTLAMVGEQGKEAVVPLENNTEWMYTLASIIAQAISGSLNKSDGRSESGSGGGGDIVLKVSETEFARLAIKAINTEQRRVGRNLIIT